MFYSLTTTVALHVMLQIFRATKKRQCDRYSALRDPPYALTLLLYVQAKDTANARILAHERTAS
eukprot:1367750-Pleurochrysis_carterae.AAC.1